MLVINNYNFDWIVGRYKTGKKFVLEATKQPNIINQSDISIKSTQRS